MADVGAPTTAAAVQQLEQEATSAGLEEARPQRALDQAVGADRASARGASTFTSKPEPAAVGVNGPARRRRWDRLAPA
jgi:hypothetical protein